MPNNLNKIEEAQEKIKELIDRFSRNDDVYRNEQYNETPNC